MDGAKFKVNTGDIYILNSGTMHTILKFKKYFSSLKPTKTLINTISNPIDLVEGTGRTSFV